MNHIAPPDFNRLLQQVGRIIHCAEETLDDTPLGRIVREFFQNNWINCRDGLLKRTSTLRVFPLVEKVPRLFRFELDRPFKRKAGEAGTIELAQGPICGTIHYRPDLFVNQTDLPIAVQLDLEQQYFHPNCSRQHGFVCLGELPPVPYPFPLDLFLECHLFPVLSYQNRRPSHALDREAAMYFALDADAMSGLEPVEPLY